MKLRSFIWLFPIFFHCSQEVPSTNIAHFSKKEMVIDIQIEGKTKKGYFIGIEPYLKKEDYFNEDSFYIILKHYFDYAKKEEIFAADRTIVVLPENIGVWLIFSGEKKTLFENKNYDDALNALKLDHLGRYCWIYFFDKGYANDREKETLFRMKSYQMAEYYQIVFSRLASEYRVDIVAGSIILPDPKVIEGRITVTDGPLQNVSFYFHSDGSVDQQITRKTILTEDEAGFLQRNPIADNPVFKTPLGVLYTIIGADSFHSEIYQDVEKKKADLLAVPTKSFPKSEWKKNEIMTRMKKITKLSAISVYFKGEIWESSSSNALMISKGKEIISKKKSEKNSGMIYAIGI